MMLAFCILTMNAQINVESSYKSDSKQVMIINPTYSWVYQLSINDSVTDYVIWLRTSNQFDSYTDLTLGNTPDMAIESIKNLLTLIENESNTEYYDKFGDKTNLIYRCEFGVKTLYIYQQHQVGFSWISKKQLERVLKYFEKMAQNE